MPYVPRPSLPRELHVSTTMTHQQSRHGIVWEEDPFSGPREVPLPQDSTASPERIFAYAQALEARCPTPWAYLQGHEVANDPVVHLAAEGPGLTQPAATADADLRIAGRVFPCRC